MENIQSTLNNDSPTVTHTLEPGEIVTRTSSTPISRSKKKNQENKKSMSLYEEKCLEMYEKKLNCK